MEEKSVTIYDIASEVGVSPSLVSRVLSGKGSVSDKTRKRIQDVIDKYGYRPNAMARGLKNSHTMMIGYMIPHIGNEYFSNVYYEFEKHASAHGYMTILYNGKNDPGTENRILKVFDEARVEAAVIMGGSIDAVEIDPGYANAIRALSRRTPCIVCNEQAEKFGCAGVHIDTRKKAELLTGHLAKKGYFTAAILGGAESRYQTGLFQESMRQEAEKRGIEIRPEWVHGNSYNEYDGVEGMKQLLAQERIPRAVCCINDYVAYGAASVAMDAGLRVPEDIAFTGSDNFHISDILRPKMTTVACDYAQIGTLIFEQVLAGQRGEEAKQCLVDPILIERDST